VPVSLPSARVLETLFERAPEIITIVDAVGRQTMVNAAGLAILGFDPSFRHPEDGRLFVHPEDRPRIEALRHELDERRDRGDVGDRLPPIRFRVRNGAGQWRWLEMVTAEMSDVPEVHGRVAFSRDVTEAEERRRALLESETRLAALVASLRSGAFVEDARATVVLANDRLDELLDPAPGIASLVGGPVSAVFARLREAGLSIEDAVPEADHAVVPQTTRSGHELDVEIVSLRAGDEALGRLWLFHDATARRLEERRQQALLELEQHARQSAELHAEQLEAYDRLRNDFVTHVSHELRTPLTAIASASQLLRSSREPLPPEADRHLAIIERNADRLRGMIEDLLVVGRLDAGVIELEWSSVSPAAVLNDVISSYEPVASLRQVAVHLDADADLIVRADERRLAELAANLLDNAVKYTTPATDVTVRATTTTTGWQLAVSDHGPGVPPDQREAVFDRFVRTTDVDRTTAPGAGLGLTIVRGLVELHGGRVTIDEAPGGGALVTCEFPGPVSVSAPTGDGR